MPSIKPTLYHRFVTNNLDDAISFARRKTATGGTRWIYRYKGTVYFVQTHADPAEGVLWATVTNGHIHETKDLAAD